jgi:uncharacterized membrane protein YdfJ with MMPL/SSD domain
VASERLVGGDDPVPPPVALVRLAVIDGEDEVTDGLERVLAGRPLRKRRGERLLELREVREEDVFLARGGGLIGLDSTGPIESFLPVIVFSILFGLSMDYEVFLVSRIREEYVHGDASRPAIIDGMGAIGRVVMAAAAIMAVVFFSFVLGPERTIKEFGVALGAAIVIDAFLVRLTLVPAVMWLLDRRAWYMPAWLDRILPRLTIEPPVSERQLPEPPLRPVPAGASASGD